MKEYLGTYDDLTWSKVMDLNFWLNNSIRNNQKEYSLENGKLYLQDKTTISSKWKHRNEARQ